MNKLGMTITNSHISKPSIEEQIKLFSEIGFDTFFLSCGVTDSFEKKRIYLHSCAKYFTTVMKGG